MGKLVPFDTDNPGGANFGAPIGIVGTDGRRVLGIDYRPSTGELYGVDEGSRLYRINPTTGSASQVGAPGAVVFDPFVGVFQGVGFDFDPTSERLRATEDDGLVNGQDDNFSIDPGSGILTQHSDLGGAATDVDIAGIAYVNSLSAASAATPYAIETNQPVTGNSRLVAIHPADAGTLFNIDRNTNGLGVAVDSQNIGFDITGSANRALATLSVGGVFGLYRIDLEFGAGGTGTGDATLVGQLRRSRRQLNSGLCDGHTAAPDSAGAGAGAGAGPVPSSCPRASSGDTRTATGHDLTEHPANEGPCAYHSITLGELRVQLDGGELTLLVPARQHRVRPLQVAEEVSTATTGPAQDVRRRGRPGGQHRPDPGVEELADPPGSVADPKRADDRSRTRGSPQLSGRTGQPQS